MFLLASTVNIAIKRILKPLEANKTTDEYKTTLELVQAINMPSKSATEKNTVVYKNRNEYKKH